MTYIKTACGSVCGSWLVQAVSPSLSQTDWTLGLLGEAAHLNINVHRLKQPSPQTIERSPAWQHEANPRSCFIVNHLLQKTGFQHHRTRTRRDLLHGNMESQMFHCPPSLTINQFSNPTPLRPCLEVPSKSSLDGVWQPPR